MRDPTAMELRIDIKNEFYREARTFSQTDGVMREMAARHIDRLLDEFNAMNEIFKLETAMEPTNDPSAA